MRLKDLHGAFIRNSTRSLELMLPPECEAVTANCPTRNTLLPLWLEGDHFTTPFCCYGNDVDCSRCGAWVVFEFAARREKVFARRGTDLCASTRCVRCAPRACPLRAKGWVPRLARRETVR